MIELMRKTARQNQVRKRATKNLVSLCLYKAILVHDNENYVETKSFKIAVPDWGLQLLKLSRRVNATQEDA